MNSTLIKDFSKPLGIPFPSVYAFYTMAMQYVKKDFSWAEFGTFRGISARIFLQFLPQNKNFYLFDSFEGLPEEWADSKGDEVSPAGTFARQVPEFDDHRAILKVGWFEDTISPFIQEYKEKGLSFIHVDCDLYSSTKTVLNGVRDLITPETVLIFDELCGVLRHQEHEYKAFEEFVLENNLEPEYLCSEKNNTRVALRLK